MLPSSRRRFEECTAPGILIWERVQHAPRRLHFAFVECFSACGDARLVVRDARRTIRRRISVPWSKAIGLPARTRLAGDEVRVRVVVNGRHVARRTVRLR